MKTPQLLIMLFLAMLGIAMIIHAWGDFGVAAFVSDAVGIILILIGIVSFVFYYRRRNPTKPKIN